MTSPHTSFRRPLARPAVEGRRRPASRSGACALLATAQGLPPPSPSRPAPPVLPSVLVTPVYNLQTRSAVPGSSWFLVSGERADSPLAPRGSVFRCLQQSSLRRWTQVPPPPCSLLGSLEQGSPPLPTWPSAGHQRLPCGHIQGSPFRSHLSQLSEPLPAPQDSVFSRLGGCAWVHLASLLHPD